MEDRLHSINATLLRIPVSRTTLYGMLDRRELRSVKIGSRRLIPESAINDYIAHLQSRSSPDAANTPVSA